MEVVSYVCSIFALAMSLPYKSDLVDGCVGVGKLMGGWYSGWSGYWLQTSHWKPCMEDLMAKKGNAGACPMRTMEKEKKKWGCHYHFRRWPTNVTKLVCSRAAKGVGGRLRGYQWWKNGRERWREIRRENLFLLKVIFWVWNHVYIAFRVFLKKVSILTFRVMYRFKTIPG